MHVAAVYFIAVAIIAAYIGQHVVRKLIIILGRASLIIFILAFMIFVSAISLGELHFPIGWSGEMVYPDKMIGSNFTVLWPLVYEINTTWFYFIGGVGISNMIGKIQRHEYMGFENLCK